MKIALVETRRSEGLVVNKDKAGGFGTDTDAGKGIIGRILTYVKKQGVVSPVIFMAYMQSIFEKEGHNVKFFDRLPDGSFDIVIIYGSMVDYRNELKLARQVKSSSNAKVGFLGPFTMVRPDIFLKEGDFVISGEPEDVTIRLAKGLVEPKGIINSELIKDLDSLPFPNWDDHSINQYRYYPQLKKKPFLPILSSRGCPYDCHYCPYMVMETPQWRYRSPKNVVDEIEYLIEKYKVKSLQFRDPMFTMDMKRSQEISEEIIKRKIDVEWVCETRVDRLNEPLINIMHKAGCRSMNTGIEAFDIDLLKNMNRKPPTIKLQEKIINYCEKVGMRVAAFYVLGIPGQTKDGMLKTIEYAKHLNTSYAQFNIATPYPGTEFHEQVKDNIMTEDYEKYTAHIPIIKSEEYSPEEILEIKETAFKKYYLRWQWIQTRAMGAIVA